MRNEWIIVGGSSIGLSHKKSNLPCQDNNRYFLDSKSKLGFAVVSDGAGSALNSHLGSTFIVENSIDIFRKRINEIGLDIFLKGDEKGLFEFSCLCFTELRMGMQDFGEKKSVPFKSLAATAILVVFSSDFIFCTHIGDGRAGVKKKNGGWEPIMEPFKGNEPNQTVFLTSKELNNPQENEGVIRFKMINEKVEAFTLLTDGCEKACFKINSFNSKLDRYFPANHPNEDFFDFNITALKELKNKGVSDQEMNRMWLKFLEDGNEKFKEESDDKTIILATLDNE